ncbi:MAG: fluoride efflux transporter CrcB [Bacteroidia bacterium]|nr:fluoride efflux transporter CrcB [Bacteroidia bacterium]
MVKNLLAVGAGGAVGAMLRYGMTVLGAQLDWSSNLSTFLVNIIGSFVMGLLVSCCEQSTWLMMATVGLCGGFTTFSTFSMQSVRLIQEGKWGTAALYISGTLVICILMAWLGCLVGQRLK